MAPLRCFYHLCLINPVPQSTDVDLFVAMITSVKFAVVVVDGSPGHTRPHRAVHDVQLKKDVATTVAVVVTAMVTSIVVVGLLIVGVGSLVNNPSPGPDAALSPPTVTGEDNGINGVADEGVSQHSPHAG